MSEEGTKIAELDNRLDSFAERMAAVEAVTIIEKKGVIKRASEVGGLIALVLSLALGGFTLREELVVKPQEAERQHGEALRNAISELSKIQSELNSIDWNDPAAQNKLGSYAPRRVALLEKIRKHYKTEEDSLTFADHLLVALELMQFSKIDDARVHISAADSFASDHFQRAIVDVYEARVAGYQQDFSKMSESFSKATEEYLSLGVQQSGLDLFSTYIEWIGYEMAFVSCESASTVHEDFLKQLASSDVWPRVRERAKTGFDSMLTNQNKSCGFDMLNGSVDTSNTSGEGA